MKIIRSDWEKKLKFCLRTCGLSGKKLFVCFVCFAASRQPVGYAKQRLLAVSFGLSLAFWVGGVALCACSPRWVLVLLEWRQMRPNFGLDRNFVISLLW
jgi:hypothetical protein